MSSVDLLIVLFILPSISLLIFSSSLSNALLIWFLCLLILFWIIWVYGFCFLPLWCLVYPLWEIWTFLDTYCWLVFSCLLAFFFLILLCFEPCGLIVIKSCVSNVQTSLVNEWYTLGMDNYWPLSLLGSKKTFVYLRWEIAAYLA